MFEHSSTLEYKPHASRDAIQPHASGREAFHGEDVHLSHRLRVLRGGNAWQMQLLDVQPGDPPRAGISARKTCVKA